MKKNNILAGGLLFIIFGVLYLFQTPQTIIPGDSAEFAITGMVLGVCHPPGYPLYSLLSRLAILLQPSNPAWAINSLSAVLSALAIGAIFFWAASLTGDFFIALGGAFFFGFSRSFLSTANIAEVYSLNALIAVIILLFFQLWYNSRNIRYVSMLCFFSGLGLANHFTLALLIIPLLLFILIFTPERKWLVIGTAFFILGLTPYLYIIIRANLHPALNWNEPVNWSGFIQHIIRSEYRYSLPSIRNINTTIGQQWYFLKSVGEQWMHYLLFLPILGLFKLRKNVPVLILTLISFIVTGPLLTGMLNFKLSPAGTYHLVPFWMLCVIILMWWNLEGLIAVRSFITNRLRISRLLSNLLIFLLSLIPLSVNFGSMPSKYNRVLYDFGQNVLNSVPENSTLIVHSDLEVFSTAYLQMVENRRRDLRIYDMFGSVFPNIYGKGFVHLLPDSQDALRARVFKKMLDSAGVIYFTKRPEDIAVKLNAKIFPRGMVYALSRSEQKIEDMSDKLSISGNVDFWLGTDYLSRHIIGQTMQRIGENALWQKNIAQAGKYFRITEKVCHDNYNVNMEMAGTFMALGYYKNAAKTYQKAHSLDTMKTAPLLMQARAMGKLGMEQPARILYMKYLRRNKTNDTQIINEMKK